MADVAEPIDPKEGLVEFAGFLGLRNNIAPELFSRADLVTAMNVDIDDALRVRRRKGSSAPLTGAIDRDLWAAGSVCLGVGSNALIQLFPDYTTKSLRSGLTPSRPMAYAALADRVYYSNGVELGCVQNGVSRTWGLVLPGVPVATATPGVLAPGNYQYAVTYLRNDGQESGTPRAGMINLAVTGGVLLTNIPVSADPTVTQKAIYISAVDGETLYRTGVVSNATTTFLIDTVRPGATPLITQFLSPPPAGTLIAESRGHMLVAAQNMLYPSEPYSPELFDLRKGVPFLDNIVMVAPISDGKFYRQHGVFIGTNSQVIWLEGDAPERWQYRVIADYGVIPGTLYYGSGELLGAGEYKERIAFFASKTGLCAGKMGGEMVNLTQARFAYPVADRGASVVRRHNGMAQFVVTMQGTQVPGNVFVQ